MLCSTRNSTELNQCATEKGCAFQPTAYDHCFKTYASQGNWLGAIDIDEFIVDVSGLPDLQPNFFAEYLEGAIPEAASAMAFSRIPFYNNGLLEMKRNHSLVQTQQTRITSEAMIQFEGAEHKFTKVCF
jgi:hypothetical protein